MIDQVSKNERGYRAAFTRTASASGGRIKPGGSNELPQRGIGIVGVIVIVMLVLFVLERL